MCILITAGLIFIAAEIVTTSGSHYLSVDSLEERDQWAESIKKASVNFSHFAIYGSGYLDPSCFVTAIYTENFNSLNIKESSVYMYVYCMCTVCVYRKYRFKITQKHHHTDTVCCGFIHIHTLSV